MKLTLATLLAFSLASLVGCQSDMTGVPRADAAVTSNSADLHPGVSVGDAYFEEAIGRYDLSDAK